MFEKIMKKEKSKQEKSEDLNIPFLFPLEIGIQSIYPTPTDLVQRIQGWSLNDEMYTLEERLSDNIERRLDNIDSGKEKLKEYSNADEYLKHVDQVLEE